MARYMDFRVWLGEFMGLMTVFTVPMPVFVITGLAVSGWFAAFMMMVLR